MLKNKINRLIAVVVVSMLILNHYEAYYVNAANAIKETEVNNGIDSDIEADETEFDAEDQDVAADSEWYKKFSYYIHDDLSCVIIQDFDESMTDIEIPGDTLIGDYKYNTLLDQSLFRGKKYLKRVLFGKFCIPAVEESMFENCISLEELDVSGFVSRRATYTTNKMFYNCIELQKINASGFIKSHFTQTKEMFYDCQSLTDIDFSNSDTSNITDASSMFGNCSALQELDLSGFDFSSLENADYMFDGCNALAFIKTPVNVPSNINIYLPVKMYDKNGKEYSVLPNGTESIKSIELAKKWPIEWYENYEYSLDDANNTITITGYKGNETEITVPAKAVISGKEYSTLYNIKSENGTHDLENIKTIKFKEGVLFPNDCSSMFKGCASLYDVDLSGIDSSAVTNISDMFSDCSGLSNISLSGLNTNNVTDMSGMFFGCKNLKSIDTSTLETKNVTTMDSMFSGCESLEQLDLSAFNTEKLVYMRGMFKDCSKIKHIDMQSFNTRNVRNMKSAFYGCSALQELDLSSFSGESLGDVSSMFRECSGLKSVKMGNMITGNLEFMNYLFLNCSSLSDIDLSNFDVSNVSMMNSAFQGCSSLKKIDISKWNIRKCNINGLFKDCTALEEVVLGENETQNISDLFNGCISLGYVDLSPLAG